MTNSKPLVAIVAAEAAPRTKPSNYPEPFFSRMGKRVKRPLGDLFGLNNFGVNLTRILPGGQSALRHAHSKQDEFVYILEGSPLLITDAGETPLEPGMCAGFKAGTGNGHHLVNRTAEDVVYLEIGDRSAGDAGSYPDDDIEAVFKGPGQWGFAHKDGTSY
jgi:uncharacterized cupin superfamily protein